MKNTINEAELISSKATAFQNAEGEAIILINNQKICCFLDNIQTEVLLKKKPKEKIKCILSLMTLKLEQSKEKEKKAISLWNPPKVNQYKIVGEIVEKSKEKIIVDCGFLIEINEKTELEKSEYIVAQGRIDLRLA